MTPFILWELTTARQKICRAALFVLYRVIQILQSLFSTFYEICYSHAIYYFIHSIIQFLPYLQGLTGIAAFTDVRAVFQTGHRCKGSFCQPQDHSHRIICRVFIDAETNLSTT